mmetsp:Transcript_46165/g.97941  ORF Transcript_46165/g.97941 Transcript_46165/m.97941 type:complete len:97 (+) Transcript_46165:189-479(+)
MVLTIRMTYVMLYSDASLREEAAAEEVRGATEGEQCKQDVPGAAARARPVLTQGAQRRTRLRRPRAEMQKTTTNENLWEFEVSFMYAMEYTTSEAR